MNFIKNISIKSKITSIILIISTLTLIVGFVIVGISNIKNLKQDMLLNNLMNTRLIGEYAVAPLTFNDNEGAETILSKLSTIPEIASGALYDHNGELFAYYKRDESVIIPLSYENPDVLVETYSQFSKDLLIINNPILYEGIKYGIICICVDTNVLSKKIKEYITILFFTLLGMIFFSFILANRFQKIISQPILDLAKLTRKISKAKDYSVRIEKITDDEIGVLYEDFNNMLSQLLKREAERDKAEGMLLKAKEKAEESDLLKSAFLANMSHEIRTPMNAILGFAELITLKDSEITQEEKEVYVKLIHNSGNNLLRLIDDIIDISKIEAGQIKIHKKECNINETLKDLYRSFLEIRKLNEKEHIEIKLNDKALSQNLLINTDTVRLNQILINLIGNSLKFTEKGYIEFGYDITDKETLLFYVKDTGVGMNREKKDLVFDRFTKIEDNNSRLYRGAGLGLAISKSLVELLGGNIWVESAPMKGSTFYFSVPFDEIKESDKIEKSSPVNENYNWENKTILVAEDEPANIMYIEEVLKVTKAKILKASNGKEAISEFKENNNVDIVIMDIKMPEMDGYEATRQIRKINKFTPIISQSAYAMPGDIERGLDAGMNDYLIKPIKPNALLSIINKHFNK